MSKKIIIICYALLSFIPVIFPQSILKGTVKDYYTHEPLVGANILISGTKHGTATNSSGKFTISNINPGTYDVVISFIGYTSSTLSISILNNETKEIEVILVRENILSKKIVITASKKPEKLTEAPSTINVISSNDLETSTTFNIGELFARQKGVDFIRTGILATGLNIRGLNNAFNTKNLQLVDNRLSTLITTGFPFGPLGTYEKDDIDRIEIVLGPSAVLYGPNAYNGLINIITKDPRTTQGTTVAISGGNQSLFSGRFRYAKDLNNKFSFKVSGEYTQGLEYNYTDSVYVGNKGFPELDLDRRFNSLKGQASLYYNIDEKSDIIFTYGRSVNNNISNTTAGRNQIKDWKINILQGQYSSPHLYAQLYFTWSNTTDTYSLNQRTQNYVSFINAGFSDAIAKQRSFKEAWAGTSPTSGVALKRGALFKDDSKRLNGEIQYNNIFGNIKLVTGLQLQRDMANSNNTYLLDGNGIIQLDQIGGYAQVEYEINDTGLKLIVAARGDNHELYGFNFIPKAGVLYTTEIGTFRITYGKGIQAPSILNLSSNIFGGLILGNGEGFTLSDGTIIPKLKVETINTIEAGYKGLINNKLFFDVNAYYNISEHFISPLINIATNGRRVTKRGNTPIQEIVPGIPPSGSPFLQTNLNFGKVNTYGFDIGINYFLNNNISLVFNYSYFNFNIDTNDLANDGDRNGKVTETDLPMNTPTNKFGFGINWSDEKYFGSIFSRWVEKYDNISGINVAASTNTDLVIGGTPVVENARVGRSWNYGPLGGFFNLDLSLGYKFTSQITFSVAIVNLFNASVREFSGAPFIDRLVTSEVKFNF